MYDYPSQYAYGAPPPPPAPAKPSSSGTGWIIAIVVLAIIVFTVGGCWSSSDDKSGTQQRPTPIAIDSVNITQPTVQALEQDNGVAPAPHQGTMPRAWQS